MKHAALGTSLALCLLGLSAETGCTEDCNPVDCGGQLTWEGRRADDGALEEGEYTLTFVLEDDEYVVTCLVAATIGTSTCGEPEVVRGSDRWYVVGPQVLEAYATGPDQTVPGGFLLTFDGKGRTPPATAQFVVQFGGTTLVDATYAFEYAPFGPEGAETCGSCFSSDDAMDSW